MFICPYYSYESFYRMPEIDPISYIRFLNASPNSPAIDVYLNDRRVFKNLTYKSFSDYVSVPSGVYDIKIFPSGNNLNPILDKRLRIPAGKIFTMSSIGNYPNMGLLPIEDVRRPKISGKAFIRFVHLSPDAPSVDVKLPNGNVLFPNVSYKGVTRYLPVSPGKYTLEVFTSDSGKKLLHIPNIRIIPNRFYSVYAVGNVSRNPKLQVLIPLDGNSYLH
ncbi:DUF4397 domain-containing protein [Clostridium ljungdahlii]|uniref:DUF4397 domain-containing protein n=1 Tax=Clostridium ljungdahlii TaxID=1538 RepID=A0A168LK74_9CLOT|nr:DUF4397 domain-containing protein [Clostridium ljungdahlii]OAA83343.1 hypothetical protein WY13_03671 [Clostridium ljungdahlii]